ncbi:MAG: hypothetical protein HOP19_19090 [Acidobacteria bacterium]|nr:hypothetical protein [Acidobacteriota bacterium]
MVLKVLSLGLLALLTSTCHVIAQEPQSVTATAKLSVPVATATPKVEASPSPALDQLMTALAAAQQAKSFRARLESQIEKEDPDELTLEIAAPDRRRIKGHNLEIIVIGADGYLSFGGRWQKAPRDPEAKANVFKVAQAPVFWGFAENEAARALITIKSVIPTTDNEQAVTLFEYEMKDAFGKTGVCRLRTWVNQTDGLPRKTEMEGDYEGRHARAVLTWLEYNAALTIEAPTLP